MRGRVVWFVLPLSGVFKNPTVLARQGTAASFTPLRLCEHRAQSMDE
jgi:hypothetical protein